MKKLFLIITTLLTFNFAKAQEVFVVENVTGADVTVFVVESEVESELNVYKVGMYSQASGNDGKWFFSTSVMSHTKKICFVNYANQADLKVYFTVFEHRAGWKNLAKKKLMD